MTLSAAPPTSSIEAASHPAGAPGKAAAGFPATSRFTFEAGEAFALGELLATIAARYRSAEDPAFLAEAAVLAHELPRRLRAALYSFKLHEPAEALFVVSGLPVDDEAIGDTPAHWRVTAPPPAVRGLETAFVLVSSLLGECFGWRTQQGGNIIHNVLPMKSHEDEQIGTGSNQLIWWHTEDAFHPYRGDYVAMLCLRNPDRVPTTFAAVDRLGLRPDTVRALFEPHYTIHPDESHRRKSADGAPAAGDLDAIYQGIDAMHTAPAKIALLEGDPRSPYLRIDPYFMDPVLDPRAQGALEDLSRAVDAELTDVVLAPGDLCFIDNFKAVHGRRPFKARYDGRDRWLKRLNVARDLRRSRAGRAAAASRIVL